MQRVPVNPVVAKADLVRVSNVGYREQMYAERQALRSYMESRELCVYILTLAEVEAGTSSFSLQKLQIASLKLH